MPFPEFLNDRSSRVLPESNLSVRSDNTATNVNSSITRGLMKASAETNAQYEALKKKYPQLANYSFEDLVEFDRLMNSRTTPVLSQDNRFDLLRQQSQENFKAQEEKEKVKHNIDVYDRTAGRVINWTPLGGFAEAGVSLMLDDAGFNNEASSRGLMAAIRTPFDLAGGAWGVYNPLRFATSTAGALAGDYLADYTNASPAERFLLTGIGGAAGAGVPDLANNIVGRFNNGWFRLGNTEYRPSLSTMSMGMPSVESRPSIKNNLTSKYLELLGNNKDINGFTESINNRSINTRPFAEYLESLGIDSSLFSEADINKLMQMRSKSVQSSIPEKGRSGIVYEMKRRNQLTIFAIDINENGNQLGEIQARNHVPNHPQNNEVPIDMINRIEVSPSKGFSEDAYNAAIDYIHLTGIGEGIVSGERLLSPEITYKVWNHYPNKKLLHNRGHHSFGTGRDIKDQPIYETHEGPVFMLSLPSKTPVIIKSNHIFHPDMIENGKLLPPNWNKHGILYFTFIIRIKWNVHKLRK